MKCAKSLGCALVGLLCWGWGPVHAQTDRQLDESSVRSPHIGLVFGGAAPQGDWATRFGFFGQVGMSAGLKTKSNGYMFLKAVSWSGADVKEPGLLADLTTEQGHIIDNEGDIAQITVSGRGGQFGIGVGKIFPAPWSNPNRMDGQVGLRLLAPQHSFDYSENPHQSLGGRARERV